MCGRFDLSADNELFRTGSRTGTDVTKRQGHTLGSAPLCTPPTAQARHSAFSIESASAAAEVSENGPTRTLSRLINLPRSHYDTNPAEPPSFDF